MNKKQIIIFLLLVALPFSGCTMLNAKITSSLINDISSAGDNFGQQMTAFMIQWPYMSGVLEGYFSGRASDITLAMREGRENIDQIWLRGKDNVWTKKDLGLAYGYCLNLFTQAVHKWIVQALPQLMGVIPVIPG